ncbi:hypothetical protein LX32DRAFT_706436 [Colletotrichum zoysiae]|uniref:Uncharacterized protein n=1 Tax=Colletotrichum zoysiae TaxID=1216348 RepID=A0AAD9HPY1_9PEZI|nr:hypothetical protein LX32DRAFT_706436 [Colletotrichum zoysiae]
MSTITPLTMDVDQSSTDPFVDEGTPLNDTPIPLNLSSARPRPKSPDLEGDSSSLSSELSTPTKAPADRRRATPPVTKLTALQAATREIRSVAAEMKETRDEYKRARDLFEHLTRDENATVEILDAVLAETSRCLVRAVEDDERTQSGNPPKKVPYPPEKIPELLAALEKAEADRENWYTETRQLFWIFELIDRERMPTLKLRMEAARMKEAAARGAQAAATGASYAAAAFQTPPGKEIAFDRSSATLRRKRTSERPIASPATSDASSQATIVPSMKNSTKGRLTNAAGAFETPTNKSRR